MKIILILMAIIFVYLCGYVHRGWKEDAKRARALADIVAEQPKLEAEKYAAEKKLELKLDTLLDSSIKLNNEVENEAKKPINVNCKFSPTGVQIINAAARAKPSI
jgi:hypothetical protein